MQAGDVSILGFFINNYKNVRAYCQRDPADQLAMFCQSVA